MRAFATDGFNHPVALREVADPEPGEGEVMIRVKAAGLNATDLVHMAGLLKDYMDHLWPLIPGIDGSGVVEQVGPGVAGFKPGDEVFGFRNRSAPVGRGTLADLALIPSAALLAKPESLAHHEAATIPHSLLTAAAAVEAAKPAPGHRIVVLGATGGVGSYAVQLLARAGAHVIAITLGDHADYARSLGAAETIDYSAIDAPAEVARRCVDGVDGVLDLASFPELTARMTDMVLAGGHVVTLMIPPDSEALAARQIEGVITSRWATEDRFDEIAKNIEDGTLRLPEIRTFPFAETREAIALLATRHVRGKLAVVMS